MFLVYHQIISQKLNDLYHKQYVVEFEEAFNKESLIKFQEEAKELERQAIFAAQQEVAEHMKEVREEKMKQKAEKKEEVINSPAFSEVPFDVAPQIPEPPMPEEKEKTPLILRKKLKY